MLPYELALSNNEASGRVVARMQSLLSWIRKMARSRDFRLVVVYPRCVAKLLTFSSSSEHEQLDVQQVYSHRDYSLLCKWIHSTYIDTDM